MSQQIIDSQTRAETFETVAAADQAIRQLRAAGFSEEQLAVVCPANFKDHFRPEVRHSEAPHRSAPGAMAIGGAIGATLGGLALAATVITGVGGLAAAGVLIGGGAIAGGFSNLITARGYEEESDDDFAKAVQRGQIVVGVEVRNEEQGAAGRLATAQRILEQAGGHATHGPVS